MPYAHLQRRTTPSGRDRNVDEVINDLQKAVEAYKQATAQYINEKKKRMTPEELEHRLEEFRVSAPFLYNILKRVRELEPILTRTLS